MYPHGSKIKNYERAYNENLPSMPFLSYPVQTMVQNIQPKQCYQFSNILPEVFYAYTNKYICSYSLSSLFMQMVAYSSCGFVTCIFFKTQHLKSFHIVTKRESSLIFMAADYH